jgi:hypothetical protein
MSASRPESSGEGISDPLEEVFPARSRVFGSTVVGSVFRAFSSACVAARDCTCVSTGPSGATGTAGAAVTLSGTEEPDELDDDEPLEALPDEGLAAEVDDDDPADAEEPVPAAGAGAAGAGAGAPGAGAGAGAC